jgi:hypothetical protein
MGRPIGRSSGPATNALTSVILFSCYVIRGRRPGDWVGGRQWIALLYTRSSRRCAAPRLLSPKPSRGSHRPRLNLPSRTRAPNPLSRLGRPLQGAATQDG